MAGFNIDEIDGELQHRIEATVEAKIQKERRFISFASDPRACPFVLIEKCGRKELSDKVEPSSACYNCRSVQDFFERCPTDVDFDKRVEEIVKANVTAEGAELLIVEFLQRIIDKYALQPDDDPAKPMVPRPIEAIPTKELHIIGVLTDIIKQLEGEDDEDQAESIGFLTEGIIKLASDS